MQNSGGLAPITRNEVYAAGVIFPIVCTLCAGLRLYARSKQKAPLGLDDWLILGALVRKLLPILVDRYL